MGRRNAGTAQRGPDGKGRANGASDRTFCLSQWEPIYHRVAEEPQRPPASRNQFAALHRALLAAGHLSDNAYVLLGFLFTKSNASSKAVHVPIWRIGAQLRWGHTKAKLARSECERLGLLVHHNRKAERDDGSRHQLGNRYGFTWSPELASIAGIDERTMTKLCGLPDLVWNQSYRKQLRARLREESVESGRAQAERGIACKLVEDICETARDYAEADEQVRQRYRGDPGLENFAIDHLEHHWPRHEAARYGRQIAMLDLSQHSKEAKVNDRYGRRPDLLALALAPLSLLQQE